jgi:predicted DNA-binding transcriptional regulator YafY
MARADTLSRMERLEKLAAHLADGNTHAIADLATHLAISVRTACRDVDVLRQRGWAIDGEAGKGGGVRLAARWPISVSILREKEAIDLLLAIAASEAMGLSLGRNLASVRESLARCFAPTDRAGIERLRRRIRVAMPVSAVATSTLSATQTSCRDTVLLAFFKQQTLTIKYQDGSMRLTTREIEPHYLLCAWPFWYVLAWDIDKQAIRTFRLDRIRQASIVERGFSLRPAAPFWQACDDIGVGV